MTKLADRAVLITGADGFIGSHLVDAMLERAASVRAFCFYNSNGSLGWLDRLPNDRRAGFEAILGDIRDESRVRRAVAGADLVLHLAALIGIPYSYEAPASYVATNVGGTLNILQAALDAGGVRVVHTSTSEVYGTPDALPITESHPLRPQSPYAASKIGADAICEAFASSYALPVTVLRPFNTFGPRQSARAIIPTILLQLQSGAHELRLGNLAPVRDFTYVSDTVDGFLRMGEADLAPGTTVQLGSGRAISIATLVKMCCELTSYTAPVVVEEQRVRSSGSEIDALVSDPRRASQLLGWTPTVSVEEGLARTGDWLKTEASGDHGRYHV